MATSLDPASCEPDVLCSLLASPSPSPSPSLTLPCPLPYVPTRRHIALSYSTTSKTYSIYADGVLLATASGDLTPGQLTSASTALASIGRVSSSASGFWAGRVSDFRTYNRLLSVTEIATIAAMTSVRRWTIGEGWLS